MFTKKKMKIVSLSLAVVMLFISIGNPIYAQQDNNQFNSESTNFGDLSDIENNTELLNKYELNVNEIKKLENEKNSFDMSSNIEDVYSIEQVKLLKLEFQNTYGTEDVFITANKSDEVKTEINGAKGIIKTTSYDSDGKIINVIEVNYFKSLDELRDNPPYTEEESREEIISGRTKRSTQASKNKSTTIVPSSSYGPGTVASIFAPRIKVKRDTRDRITITSTTKARTKSYSKSKYNWNSGNTLVFYDTIKKARSQWSSIGYTLSAGSVSTLAAYVSGLVGATVIVPPLSGIIAALGALGFTISTPLFARQVTSFLLSMVKISNTYKQI